MERYNAGSFGVTAAFPVKEGNLTMVTTQGVGGDMKRPSLANPVSKGMGLKVAGPRLFEPCAAGDVPICFAEADPVDWTVEPTTSANDGDYERRYCSLGFRGTKIMMVTLEAANSAITAGDYIKPGTTTAQCFDKGTASNGIAIALDSAAANKGGEILVLFL